jgi:ATP-dependent helicase/nuclease subunit A
MTAPDTRIPAVEDVEKILARTNQAQAHAADPGASVWVNANAGTGKTHVLTRRVLRLLLSGTRPERILCLTYTKAAAAEMSKRVFDELAKWVTESDEKLNTQLADLLGKTAAPQEIALARTLFTKAIETPGGLKVQTIHAFAERLLQRFPLEANVPPGFKILDDQQGGELRARAIDATLTTATSGQNTALKRALTSVIRFAADAQFDELLATAMSHRDWIETMIRMPGASPEQPFYEAEKMLLQFFDVEPGTTADALNTERATFLSDAELEDLAGHLETGSSNDLKVAAPLREALRHKDRETHAAALAKAFLVDEGKSARKSMMTAKTANSRPDLHIKAEQARDRFFSLTQQLAALTVIDATLALYRLSSDVLQRYQDAKMSSGALDFDDLIRRTKLLLSDSSSAAWVLFKLDGGLDHILVDEAQDTSPPQWRIIETLVQEFFAGQGASETRRTVFAVGDEKQSIYSFQGAAPEMFSNMGQLFKALAGHARAPFQPVQLELSFRTTEPVLRAVDAVFADTRRTPGVGTTGQRIHHDAIRVGHAGCVEIWPTETPGDVEAADAWDPFADSIESTPANRLAERIATHIRSWLDNGERLASQDRPVRPSDILILVRKRTPFAAPMVAALKRAGIPVAGADRMTLNEQIAVQDLLVLGDFLTLPEDDLALATVLKGPLFDCNDDDLLGFATGRKGAALWKALLANADQTPSLKAATETLKRWRAKADFLPPFEFFSQILDKDGGRSKLLHRLGAEAAEAIDEFLDLAIAYDDGSPPSLTGFLASLRAADHDIKRDMDLDRDEVRVMTVHGAKGLEAPIVFLPDTCTTRSGASPGSQLLKLTDMDRPTSDGEPFVWPVKGTSHLLQISTAKQDVAEAETEERNRLLYVAMTRARDRLYVCGFEGTKARPDNCWYDLILNAVMPLATEATVGGGLHGWRIETAQTAAAEVSKSKSAITASAPVLPEFALRRAAAEPQLTIPLAPSRLEPFGMDEEGEPVMRAANADRAIAADHLSPLELSNARRFLRGSLTHSLLQHLPAIPEAARRATAKRFIELNGKVLSESVRDSIVTETLAILNDGAFAPLFGPDSRAEVAVSANLPRPDGLGTGPGLRLSGQIDRLAVTDDAVLIVDYKTNRPPPFEIEKVAKAYIYQLAAYVLAIAQIYPGKPVRAALLWTDGPRLMPIPGHLIESAIKELWTLDSADLDGV